MKHTISCAYLFLFMALNLVSCTLSSPQEIHIPLQPSLIPSQTASPSTTTRKPSPNEASQVGTTPATNHGLTLQDFQLVSVSGEYLFTEGPAVDPGGNVFFSDVNAGKIFRWLPEGSVSVYFEGLNRPNGLEFDSNGNLIACEGGSGRIISIDPQGKITTLADQYNGTRFNEPNDLWIDPQGGIYFTDPAFEAQVVQDGENVYYISPDHNQVTRVIHDMIRPNGIVGAKDGKTLYVADYGAGKTYSYEILGNGILGSQKPFVAIGSDGMDVDGNGDLYLTWEHKVQIFDREGNRLQDIAIDEEEPTNIAFAGANHQTLFITARTKIFTAVRTGTDSRPTQSQNGQQGFPTSNATGLSLSSPEVVDGGLLPVDFTCDGNSSTLPIAWSGAPAGTKSFAVIMHPVATSEDVHSYWVLYDIPATVTSLSKNTTGIGTLGINSVNDQNAYTPPCSKGPGPKKYIFTIYAHSDQPQLSVPPTKVNRAVLLDAIRGITIASAEPHVIYSRK
jgi:gluconolactonase